MNQLVNEKLEDAVIGTLLQIDDVRPILMPKLSIDTFSKPDNRAIFEAISKLFSEDRTVDTISVESWLKENKGWKGHETANLINYDAIYNDPEDKVDELNDKKVKRRLAEGLNKVTGELPTKPKSSTEFITDVENIIHDQVDDLKVPGLSMDEIDERDKNIPKGEQLYMGDKFFDNTYYKSVGSRKGQYEVLLAISKHGKTYEALRRCFRYAQQGYKGLYFTLEANDRFINDRLKKYFDDNNPNIKIVDTSGAGNLAEIMQTVKYWRAAWGLDYFVIDYLQRIPVKDIPFHNETPRIVTSTNKLSDLAVKEDVFCLALSQPSKLDKTTRRGYKMEPNVWDIYGSTAIMKDSFMVSSLFRPSEVEELCFTREDGSIRGVQPPWSKKPDDMIDKNTVWLRQKIVREGERCTEWVKLTHTEKGLRRQPAETKVPF